MVAVDLTYWEATHAALYAWTPEARGDAVVQTRVVVTCVVRDKLLPIGITLAASVGPAVPLRPSRVNPTIAAAMGVPLAGSGIRAQVSIIQLDYSTRSGLLLSTLTPCRLSVYLSVAAMRESLL